MSVPNVIVLGGSPSSGKSEIGQDFAAIETDHSTAYISADIYQPVTQNARVLVGVGAQSEQVPGRLANPTTVLQTLMRENRADLMVLDDATLSPENVGALKRFANILAVCNVTAGSTEMEDALDTSALDYLRYQQRHPFFELDGTRPVFENVAALRAIHVACQTYDMRRPERL